MARVSNEILRFMSVIAIVNFGIAALGAAIAYYVYFRVSHPANVHYMGKYGEVAPSAAIYVGVPAAFQGWVLVLSVIGRWGANRRHFLDDVFKNRPQPTDRDRLMKITSSFTVVMQLVALTITAAHAVTLATAPVAS
jgi:hypothetical protein